MAACEHDDGTSVEVVGDGVEIGEDQVGLFAGTDWIRRPDEDQRRLAQTPKREQRAEVSVMRDDDPIVRDRVIKDFVVRSAAQIHVANRDRVVPDRPQPLGQPR
ncbi:MAG TPA: hypothetical protein VM282_27450 [Acidimicrobiales bacterium]|nr:hypothetical protein [Acidimicrobiales bacterium]